MTLRKTRSLEHPSGQAIERRGELVNGPAPALETVNVSKYFAKDGTLNHVLSEVSISVKRGEFAAIIGPSGCGKSTLLKVLAGLEPFQSGRVEVLGQRPGSGRFEIGFVFQNLALLPWRTVLDNVLLPTEFVKIRKSAAVEKARYYLDIVGLSGYENYHLREISGGMRQRVALARVLMGDAKVLLLDEPFSALDELTRESINMLFMDVCAKTGTAALLVTHSIQEAALMSDRVFVMSPRPARICKEIVVPIGRPRHRQVMSSDEFADAVSRIRSALGLDEGSDGPVTMQDEL
jgi:NitT/TauT family transport system ATP-binding protein